ncbi:MAG: HDOD domain-containing protein [Pseudomonadota bacterium]
MNYEIERTIGKGGMATVYLARAPGSDVAVALKVLNRPCALLPSDTERTVDQDFSSGLARFKREIGIQQGLRHPNIVSVVDAGLDENNAYLAMEYLSGGDLHSRIGPGLPPLAALCVLRELSDALAHAHALGVVHRDIKPTNVLFHKDGHAVLSDFGIARFAGGPSLTTTGTMVGSPCYSSPEQIDGGRVDQRSDLYNLGLVLFEMLTGQRAYDGNSPLQVILAQVRGPIPHLPEAYGPLQPLLDRLLAKRKTERFQDAVSLVGFLDRLIAKFGDATVEPLPLMKVTSTDRAVEHCRLGLLEDLDCDRLVLPTLPAASARIRAIVESSRASVPEIVGAVALEPALSAQLMRLANSAFYGGQPVRDLHAAVVRLGTRAIQHIVMLLLLARVFDESVGSDMRARLEETWARSLRVAFLAEAISEELEVGASSEALLAGLVADVGALPILAWAVDVPHVRGSEQLLSALLRRLKPELGRAILARWEYPAEFLEVTETADLPVAWPPGDLQGIVAAAQKLATYLEQRPDDTQLGTPTLVDFPSIPLEQLERLVGHVERREEALGMCAALDVYAPDFWQEPLVSSAR